MKTTKDKTVDAWERTARQLALTCVPNDISRQQVIWLLKKKKAKRRMEKIKAIWK